MEIPVIIALVISVVALGLGVWALIRKPTVSIMDLEELSMFPAEIKDMYKKNITRKVIPAVMEKANLLWGLIPLMERQEAAKEAEAQTDYYLKYYKANYSTPENERRFKAEFYPFLKELQSHRMEAQATATPAATVMAAITQAPVVKQVVTAMVKATKPPARTARTARTVRET